MLQDRVQAILRELQVKQQHFASVGYIDTSTFSRWMKNKVDLPEYTLQRIEREVKRYEKIL